MRPKSKPDYLAGYSTALAMQVRRLIETDQLAGFLRQKYPLAHDVRTDKALYVYVQKLKCAYLGNAGQLSKVVFDNKLHVISNALGTHSRIARVQGTQLKSRREIRVAAMFREMPPEFLRMIVVHELAHMKEEGHDKAFYQLCRYMEPDYAQLEFDLRAYLTFLDAGGAKLWAPASTPEVLKVSNL